MANFWDGDAPAGTAKKPKNFWENDSPVPGIGFGDTPAPQDLLNQVGPGSSPAIGQGSIGAAESDVPARPKQSWSDYLASTLGQKNTVGGALDAADDWFYAGDPNSDANKSARAITHGVVSGGLAGFDEEVSAAAKAFGDTYIRGSSPTYDAAYDQSLAHERAVKKQVREEHPGLMLAGEVLGSAALPLGLLGQFAKARPIVASGLTGLGYGAAYGFGEGEGGFQNRLASSGTGAILGGLFSGGLGVGGKIAGAVIGDAIPAVVKGTGRAASRVLGFSPEQAAMRDIAKAARKAAAPYSPGGAALGVPRNQKGMAGADVTGAINKIDDANIGLGNLPSSPTMIADVDPAFSDLLRRVHTGGGPARSLAENTLLARQKGSRDVLGGEFNTEGLKAVDGPGSPFAPAYKRLLNRFGAALGVNKGESAYKFTIRKVDELQKQSAVNYGAAWKAEQPFDLMPAIANYSAKIRELGPKQFASMRAKANQFFDMDGAGQISKKLGDRPGDLVKFHNRKQFLDGEIAKTKNTYIKSLLTQLKYDMLAAVEKPNPKYGVAREHFKGEKDILDAVDEGRKAFAKSDEENAAALAAMTPGEKYGFVLGMHEGVGSAVKTKVLTGDVTQKFRTPAVMETLNAMLPKRHAQDLNTLINSLNKEHATFNKVLGGTQTTNKAADLMDPGAAGTVVAHTAQAATGHFYTPLIQGAGKLIGHYFKMREDTATEIAKLLMTTDPAKQARVAFEIDRRLGPGAAKKAQSIISQLTSGPPVSAAVGMASGQSASP